MTASLMPHVRLPALPAPHPALLAACVLAACGGRAGDPLPHALEARAALPDTTTTRPATERPAAEHSAAGSAVESDGEGPLGPQYPASRAAHAPVFPVAALDTYLDGFHFYNGRLAAQVEAHHYCTNVNADVAQCAIYDAPGRDARLVGLEYIVSERVFRGLPETEKALWHSHAYDVRGGLLVAPDLVGGDDRTLMARLARTYGKTWRTWRTDARDAVPLGIPQLMMAFTGDGQADLRLLAERDRRIGVTSAANARLRADLPVEPPDDAANGWERGWALQLELQPQRTADATDAAPR